jgi:hypothetical protein
MDQFCYLPVCRVANTKITAGIEGSSLIQMLHELALPPMNFSTMLSATAPLVTSLLKLSVFHKPVERELPLSSFFFS